MDAIPLPIRSRYKRRFTGSTAQLSLIQTILHWKSTGEFSRTKYVFEEVLPDDPRYDNAPYEESFVYDL